MSRFCRQRANLSEAHSGKIADKEYRSLSIAAPSLAPKSFMSLGAVRRVPMKKISMP